MTDSEKVIMAAPDADVCTYKNQEPSMEALKESTSRATGAIEEADARW